MGIVAFIGITLLMIFNLFLYHKIFHVVYFDLGKGLLKEIVGAYIVAVIEAGIFITVGQAVLVFLLTALGWILGVVAIIAVLAAVIYIVYKIVRKIKGRAEGSNETSNKNDLAEMNINDDLEEANNENDFLQDDIKTSGEDIKSDNKVYFDNYKEQKTLSINENFNEKYINKGQNIFCPYCGKQISRNANFCKFCGKENTYGNGEKKIYEM